MKFGLQYKGSKSKIAQKIVDLLPPADTLFDLFAGGCAITHCALLSGKFGKVISNDHNNAPRLFKDACDGKYRAERRFITREMFFANKALPPAEQDPYIKFVWSFGNNGRSYLFGKGIEPLKHEAHDYLMAGGYDGTVKSRIDLLKKFKQEAKIAKRFDI